MTNSSSAEQVAERLTRYYLAALSIMAILCFTGLGIINSAIQYHESDGRVLNISGKQRMWSQQLTKLALLQYGGHAAADSTAFVQGLETWNANQLQLEEGFLQMEENYLVSKSRDLREKFQRLKPVYTSLYRHLEEGLHRGISPALMGQILENEALYLQQMDAIVFRFDRESRERVKNLRIIEYILASVTLLTLLLEILFVFRPVVKYTRKIIHELSDSKKELYLANQQLYKVNHHLSLTQQQVINLYEARHQQLRMEDQIRAAALMEGQEKERIRLAAELHDGVGQMLTGLNLLVARLRKLPPEDPRFKKQTEEISAYIQEIIRTTRQISHNVMPDTLVDYGLAAALRALTDQVTLSAASRVTLEVTGEPMRLAPAREIGLYRIAQEALNNALKYSEAKNITITLNFETDKVVLKIEDDGIGFPPDRQQGWQSTGIDNMRTRARLLGTEFSLDTAAGKGTAVTVKFNP